MTAKWRWAILGGGLGLYLIGMGFLGGLVAERVRFDHQRSEVLNRYDEAVRKWQAYLMRLELQAPARQEASDASATTPVRAVDEALAKNAIDAAGRAWHTAYGAALGSRRWEDMVEVGDAALRLGEAGGDRNTAVRQARRAYLRALNRARQQGSLDGVLRVAEAFATLGDREVAEQCVRIAERLAAQAREAQARDRVGEFKARLAAGFSRNGGPRAPVVLQWAP